MREVFAHVAVLGMDVDADRQAPGAAITVALCGHWKHEPHCPIAPHHSQAERVDGDVRLRTLFVVEPHMEAEVRRRIETALCSGHLCGPDGVIIQWQLLSSGPSAVFARDKVDAQRLAQG